jgi:hypothetical protein
MLYEIIIIIILLILLFLAIWLFFAKPEPKWRELQGDDSPNKKLG